MEVGAGHVKRRSVMVHGRARIRSNWRGRQSSLRDGWRRAIGYGTAVLGRCAMAVGWVASLESLKLELLLTDHLKQAILEGRKSAKVKDMTTQALLTT